MESEPIELLSSPNIKRRRVIFEKSSEEQRLRESCKRKVVEEERVEPGKKEEGPEISSQEGPNSYRPITMPKHVRVPPEARRVLQKRNVIDSKEEVPDEPENPKTSKPRRRFMKKGRNSGGLEKLKNSEISLEAPEANKVQELPNLAKRKISPPPELKAPPVKIRKPTIQSPTLQERDPPRIVKHPPVLTPQEAPIEKTSEISLKESKANGIAEAPKPARRLSEKLKAPPTLLKVLNPIMPILKPPDPPRKVMPPPPSVTPPEKDDPTPPAASVKPAESLPMPSLRICKKSLEEPKHPRKHDKPPESPPLKTVPSGKKPASPSKATETEKSEKRRVSGCREKLPELRSPPNILPERLHSSASPSKSKKPSPIKDKKEHSSPTKEKKVRRESTPSPRRSKPKTVSPRKGQSTTPKRTDPQSRHREVQKSSRRRTPERSNRSTPRKESPKRDLLQAAIIPVSDSSKYNHHHHHRHHHDGNGGGSHHRRPSHHHSTRRRLPPPPREGRIEPAPVRQDPPALLKGILLTPPTSQQAFESRKQEKVSPRKQRILDAATVVSGSPSSRSSRQSGKWVIPPPNLNSSFESSHSSSNQGSFDDKMMQFFNDATLKEFQTGYIDTHCHLDLLMRKKNHPGNLTTFRLQDESIKDTWSPSFLGCIADYCFPRSIKGNAGNPYDYGGWHKIQHDSAVAGLGFGLHPRSAGEWSDEFSQHLRHRLLATEKTVCIGEMGLDYSDKGEFNQTAQINALLGQLRLSNEEKIRDKTVLIHCRGAGEYLDKRKKGHADRDCLTLMKKYLDKDRNIHLHSFMFGKETADEWFQEFPNLKIGLTPVILDAYSKNLDFDSLIRWCPLEKIVIETDSPYFLPPVYEKLSSLQRTQNHPGVGVTVALKIADVLEVDPELVLEQIKKNSLQLYPQISGYV